MKATLRLSFIVMGLLAAVLLAYDVWAQLSGGLEVTISWAWWKLAKEWPMATFILGILCGHLVFRSPGSDGVDKKSE